MGVKVVFSLLLHLFLSVYNKIFPFLRECYAGNYYNVKKSHQSTVLGV
jgi:hypothetical protein